MRINANEWVPVAVTLAQRRRAWIHKKHRASHCHHCLSSNKELYLTKSYSAKVSPQNTSKPDTVLGITLSVSLKTGLKKTVALLMCWLSITLNWLSSTAVKDAGRLNLHSQGFLSQIVCGGRLDRVGLKIMALTLFPKMVCLLII